MENIVRIEELDQCVAETLLAIQRGVAKARAEGGIIVDLPPEVQFSVTVVKEWQALDSLAGQTLETTEQQGGGSTEVVKGTETGEQTTSGIESRSETGSREVSSKETGSERQTNSGSEHRTGKDGASSSETAHRTSTDNSSQNNAHNQESDSIFKYT